MRIFVSIIVFFVFLFSLVYMVLFTKNGNDFLKPYVKQEIEKRIGHEVSINSMILKPDFIDFAITVDKKSKFVLNGRVNIFNRNFDLNYEIDARNLKTPYMYIKNHIQLTGVISGNPKKFSIDGDGVVFRAETGFSITIKDKKIQKIEINAKNARMEDILSLLNKPVYTQGVLDIHANLTSTDGTNFNGVANSIIHFGILDIQEIQKDFAIKFDEPISYKGAVNSKIQDGIVYSEGNIFSNIAQLKFKASKFNIKNKNLSSKYSLFLPNLELLKSFIGTKLTGNMEINGDFDIKGKDISLKAQSKKFGGKINISMLNKTANINFINLKSDKIFDMLNLQSFFSAKIDGDIEFSDIYSLNSQADIRLYEGRFLTKKIKEFANVDLPVNNNFSLHVNSIVRQHILSAKSDFVSTIFNLQNEKIIYNIDTKTYNGDYKLSVDNLSNVEFLTKAKLRGTFDLNGNFTGTGDKFKVNGKSKFLDSNSTFLYENNLLTMNLANISSVKLSYMAYIPEIFDSIVQANITYDVLTKKGKFHAVAKDGRLKQGEFSDLILAITKFDITQEVYDNSTLDGNINADDINFSLAMHGKSSYLKIPAGYINLKTKQTDSVFNVNIDKKDLSGEIKGSIYEPKINIKSSQYIKNKIEDVIDKKVPEELKAPLNKFLQLFD